VSSLLTPRLELGGLVGGGTLLVRFGGGLDGVSRQSLLGQPATVLVGVLAVPLPLYFSLMSFTWLIFIVYLFPIRRVLWIFLSVSLHTLCGVVFHVVCVHFLHIPSSILLSFFHFENFIDDK
jgi:hypothetical protein